MQTSPDRRTLAFGLLWGVTFIGARLLLEQPDLPSAARFVLAFGPSIPFALFLWSAIRAARALDEMQRRVQIEALAVGFGLTAFLVATLGLLQPAGMATVADFGFVHILPMMFVFYVVGRLLAGRRYGCEIE